MSERTVSKVPAITLGFWLVKVVATTLGETGGDALSMTLDLGYLVSSLIFAAIFAVSVAAQIRARTYHRFLYWGVIVATTTLGTTMADFATRSLGIGYTGGSALLLALLLVSLGVWRAVAGTVSVASITNPRAEAFYWGTILFSQTLGTALGDWVADTNDFGYENGALVFGALLLMIGLAWFLTRLDRTFLFWSAFILTRPLGATLGDLLDKPLEHGGLDIGRFTISGVLVVAMVIGVLLQPREPGEAQH